MLYLALYRSFTQLHHYCTILFDLNFCLARWLWKSKFLSTEFLKYHSPPNFVPITWQHCTTPPQKKRNLYSILAMWNVFEIWSLNFCRCPFRRIKNSTLRIQLQPHHFSILGGFPPPLRPGDKPLRPANFGGFLLKWIPSLKLTVCTWKWMVGIRSFPFGMAYFQWLC